MKLETKLGLGTGGLIFAMFLSAFTAHLRIQDATQLSNRIMVDRMPLILNVRDVRSHITGSLRALESDILFGMHEGSSSIYRAQRAEQMAQADRALSAVLAAEGNLDLKQDKERLGRVTEALAQLRTLQDRVLRLSESNSAENTAEAYVVLQKEILPLSDSTIAIIEQVVDSQTAQADADFDQLRQANHLTILTLWIATILGAFAGGAVSLILGRRIASSVGQLARRADSIAAGDLTGRALQLDSKDQIGTLAEAMNGMQAALGGIIGTVASLQADAGAARDRQLKRHVPPRRPHAKAARS